ncbi:MAG TPA: SPOR domain-containing protein [Rhodocyclaceae bacterium]|nr:SPOR domain-containing protein [Rhodocyclaceae bacterium]
MSRQVINSENQRQRGNTLVGVMLGLLVGVAIAVGVALYINFSPKPFTRADVTPIKHETSPALTQSVPIALPGKPGDAPVEKPHFDFYKILPSGDGSSTVAPTPAPSTSAPVVSITQPDHLFLQVGAFQDPSEADNLKARLTLMGLEASVQRAEVPDKGVMQRVRVGPFNTAQEVDAARVRLAQEGIESNLVRSKPQSAVAGNSNAKQ